MGVLMWPVMVFYTNSTIHMVAHGAWAQTMMLAGRGRARPRAREARTSRPGGWRCRWRSSSRVSAILVHEQNGWLFSRAAFLHHVARLDGV